MSSIFLLKNTKKKLFAFAGTKGITAWLL